MYTRVWTLKEVCLQLDRKVSQPPRFNLEDNVQLLADVVADVLPEFVPMLKGVKDTKGAELHKLKQVVKQQQAECEQMVR
jgi:hypothetical protein